MPLHRLSLSSKDGALIKVDIGDVICIVHALHLLRCYDSCAISIIVINLKLQQKDMFSFTWLLIAKIQTMMESDFFQKHLQSG